MTCATDDEYRFGLSLASLLTAVHLADAEPDEQRHLRKQAVATEKWSLVRHTYADALGELHGYGGTGPATRQLARTLERVTDGWTAGDRCALLIDLLVGDAFAPYQLRAEPAAVTAALHDIGATLHVGDVVGELAHAWGDATRAHRPSRWRLVIAGNGHAPERAPAGPPPAVVAALAEAAGFEGHAATPHGIAVLSSGSLGIGGAVYAGGRWLLRPDADDGILPAGGPGLLALGAPQARVEILKLRLNFTVVILPGRAGDPDAGTSELITATTAIAEQLRERLEVERHLNDDGARRITDIEAIAGEVAALCELADAQLADAA